MTSSTLTPRSLPPTSASLARVCAFGLASWWLLRELDELRRRLLARQRHRASPPDEKTLELSIIDTRGDASENSLEIVLSGITGTEPDHGGEIKTSPPRMRDDGPGKKIARFPGLTIRYIRSSETKSTGVAAAQVARTA